MAAHDQQMAELAHFKLGRVSATDAGGYHRVACPAVVGKLRCPLRESSRARSFSRPEAPSPPEHPPACCTQATITVPESVDQKTAQRYDYPRRAWRCSHARRSAVERSNSKIKDLATVDIARGWCRVMGLTPMARWLASAIVVRNLAVADAFALRREDDRRRIAAGRPPRSRRRRRTSIAQLAGAFADAPPPSSRGRRRTSQRD